MTSSMKFDFVILIDHVKRELEYCELLKSELSLKGYQVKLLSVNFDLWQLLFIKTKLLLIPHSIGESQVPLNFFRLNEDVTILHLDWEQELFPAFYEYKRSRSPLELAKIYRSSWSEGYSQKLENDGVSSDMVLKFPRPNQLLLQKRLSEHHEKDVDVFIPMNLTAAFLSDEQISARVSLGMDPKLYTYYVEMSRKFLAEFCKDLAHFCRDNRDKTIVLRPHPLEPVETYVEKIKSANEGLFPANLSISESGTVWDWVVRSRVIVTSWSTVALDCNLCGIACYLLRYFPIRTEFEIPSMNDLDRISSMRHIAFPQQASGEALQEEAMAGAKHLFIEDLTKLHTKSAYFSAVRNVTTIKISFKRLVAKQLVKYFGFRKERWVDLM